MTKTLELESEYVSVGSSVSTCHAARLICIISGKGDLVRFRFARDIVDASPIKRVKLRKHIIPVGKGAIMNLRILALVFICAVSLKLTAQEPPTANDRQLIQGTWKVVSGARDGQPFSEQVNSGVKLTFSKETMTAATPGGDSTFAYKLDPSQSPKAIDVEMDGQTGLGIYELAGDTLKIIHGEAGTDRPTEFDASEGTGLTLMMLERVKPSAREAVEALVAQIQRADYEGDRPALAKLHGEMEKYAGDEKLGAAVDYWRGFAVWRRAVNGFNENVERSQQERDLNQAISDFESALARQADFSEAKIGALGAAGLLLFLNQKSPAAGPGFDDPVAAQAVITKLTPWMSDLQSTAAENPRFVWVMGPNVLARGGGPDNAIEMYQKALVTIRSQEKSSDPLVPVWGEPELLMNLAWTHFNKPAPDLDAAEQNARAALKLVPYWHYVKDILLPQIEAAKANDKQDGNQDGNQDTVDNASGHSETSATRISEELLSADRAFARATAEKRLAGWMSFMAEDATKLERPGEKLIVGKTAIEQHDQSMFADESHRLVWEPVDAHVYAGGRIGLTSGRYRLLSMDAQGIETVLSQGGYVTWWRLEPDGTWKVIFDTGSPDTEKK